MIDNSGDDIRERPDSLGRRELLLKAGRYAGATPAAVLVLLSTTKDAEAGKVFNSGGDVHYHKRKKHWKSKHKRAVKKGIKGWKKGWDA